MNNQFPTISTASGDVKICSVFDFIKEIRLEKSYASERQFQRLRKEYFDLPYEKYSYNAPSKADQLYATTVHTLQLNPMKLLTELKKTTTLVERKSKVINLIQLLHELSVVSLENFGYPTHFFSIGQNRYALVNKEDVVLFTNDNMAQQLVCLHKNRNFTIYAPNLKVGLF